MSSQTCTSRDSLLLVAFAFSRHLVLGRYNLLLSPVQEEHEPFPSWHLLNWEAIHIRTLYWRVLDPCLPLRVRLIAIQARGERFTQQRSSYISGGPIVSAIHRLVERNANVNQSRAPCSDAMP